MRQRLTRPLVFLAKASLSLGLLAVLLVRLDFRVIVAALGGASWPLLAGAAALLVASNLLGSVQWGLLLRAQGNRAPVRRVASAYFVGLFFNNFLPANVGGDVARVASVASYSEGLSPSVSATVMDRLIGLFVIAAFGFCAAPVSMREAPQPLIYALVAVTFLGAGAALVAVRSRRFLRVLEIPVKLAGARALAERIERTAGRLSELAGRGRLVGGLLAVSAVTQVFRIYVHFLVARALHIPVSEAALWTFVPILAVVAALPVSLNGLGVREWAATVLLPAATGMTAAQAFAWQLTTYLVAVAMSVTGAVLFLRQSARAARSGDGVAIRAEVSRSLHG